MQMTPLYAVTPYSGPVYRNRGKSRRWKARSSVRFHSIEKSFCYRGPTSRPWRDRRNAEQTKREECRKWRGRLRARQKGSGSCPRLMHPWSPEGHETRRSGSRKRKTKEEKEDEGGGGSGGERRKERSIDPVAHFHFHFHFQAASWSISWVSEDAFVCARVYGACKRGCRVG